MTTRPNISALYTIDQYRGKYVINGNATIQTSELIDRVSVIFNRCNKEGINCEYFQNWNFNDVCQKLLEKNQIWSSWYGSFKPPLTCPINKVHYQIQNGTFDFEIISLWYPDATNYYWKVNQKLYAGNIFVGSYTIDIYFFEYTVKMKPLKLSFL
ncbi:Hypothetical protein CINCED_3A001187 [Cinara cedri]|uniref:Uncharacterized protein n=1 Tax=Cinara cedri TaxID=506608 RepID=A0A5E4MBG9_9HEMI|nr:Hypothetical protein CINCED_3A001187 [Cinara cedri]